MLPEEDAMRQDAAQQWFADHVAESSCAHCRTAQTLTLIGWRSETIDVFSLRTAIDMLVVECANCKSVSFFSAKEAFAATQR